MTILTLAVVVALAGCGGGADDAPAGQVATNQPLSAAAAASPETAPADWTLCAAEEGRCSFTGVRVVHYGTASQMVAKTLTDGTACSNAVFGDPAPYNAKSCWLEPATSAPPPATWTACAAENGICNFSGGVLQVRYGAVSSYASKPLASPVACNNATFGDPLPGVVKACAYVAVAAAPAPPAPSTDPCEALPALPRLPATYNVVTAFCSNGQCAKPDDDIDDTDAIDAALNQSAGKFLVFPPGRYLIKRSLRIKQPGVTMWSQGATIHATNWDDQSIVIEANDSAVYGFRLTAVTAQRGSRVEHTRIAIYGPAGVNPVVKNTVIRNNEIVNAGEPGSNLANAATGAGIFVNAADGFLIAGNTVARSLADGIHMTGGARNGRVLGNTVRETGDDMIAVVSYAYPDPWQNTAATILPNFNANQATYQDRNILIANNQLSGQYWGRGIAVVGGRDITIRGNMLNNIPYAAAVLLARETQSGTYGLDNVLVEKNTIRDVQTLKPPYDFNGKFAANSRTGHGAIEIHTSMFADELPLTPLLAGFTVANLTVRDNSISASATPGVRVGVATGSTWMMGTRPVTAAGPLRNITLDRNSMSDIRSSTPIQLLGGSGVASCSANTLGGNGFTTSACAASATAAPATGAALSCTAN